MRVLSLCTYVSRVEICSKGHPFCTAIVVVHSQPVLLINAVEGS